jgi:hypothetical protein
MDSIDGDDKGIRRKADRLEEMPIGPRGRRVGRWLLRLPHPPRFGAAPTQKARTDQELGRARSPAPEKAAWDVVEHREPGTSPTVRGIPRHPTKLFLGPVIGTGPIPDRSGLFVWRGSGAGE